MQPHLLLEKLKDMNVNIVLIKWLYSFLSNRTQVKVNWTLSDTKYCITGVPQGCVISPILFTLYTNDCRRVHPNYSIFKFVDDTAIVSLLHKDMDSSVYHDEINTFIKRCDINHLILNVSETQEMVIDPKQVTTHEPVVIKDQTVSQMATYKYSAVHTDNLLCWKTHFDNLCNKLQQRLYFLRRLRLYGVSNQIMLIFYRAILESIIRYGITAWFGNLTVQLKNKLAGMQKTAMKIIGMKQYEPVESLYNQAAMKQATRISADSTHPLFGEYELLPSGRTFRMPKCKTNCFKLSFVPASITLLNNDKH